MLRVQNLWLLFGAIALALFASPDPATAQNKLPVEIVPNVGHTGYVESVVLSRDGSRALSGGVDRTLKLWDLKTGLVIRSIPVGFEVASVAFSPDGARALSGGDHGKLKLWDLKTGALIRSFEGHSDKVRLVVFSLDGATAFSVARGGTLKKWDLETGALIHRLENYMRSVWSMAFSPDGSRALVASSNGALKLWDQETGELIQTIDGGSHDFSSIALSPDGRHALSGGEEGVLRLWDLEAGAVVRSFEMSSGGNIVSVAFSPDGARGYAATYSNDMELWDLETGAQIRSYEIVTWSSFGWFSFSPDGSHLLSFLHSSLDYWDLDTGKYVHSLTGDRWVSSHTAVAFTPDGARALSGQTNNEGSADLTLWDLKSGEPIRTFGNFRAEVYSITISPDGKFALVVSPGPATLWDLQTGSQVLGSKENDGSVVWRAPSPDGDREGSPNGPDETLKPWNVETGAFIRSYEEYWRYNAKIAFSRDGRRVLVGDGENLSLLDAESGALIRSFEVRSGQPRWVAFSSDGSRGYSLSTDGFSTLTLWDLETGSQISRRESRGDIDAWIAVSPDGRRAVSGTGFATARVWDVATGEESVQLNYSSDGAVAMTPDGFFNAADGADSALAVVQGFEAYTISQFTDHMRRPDLVAEALKGDPEGKVKDAASKLDLTKVLASGPAPRIEWLEREIEQTDGSVRLTVRVTEAGGGIGGKLIWRVNGKTQGVVRPEMLADRAQPDIGQSAVVTQTLRLLPGETNVVAVSAYNGAELIATPPLEITVDAFGATTEARPKMHVLALGVDAYRMAEYRLQYAAKDAVDFAAGLKVVGSELFESVETTLLLDEQVSPAAIAEAFEDIAATANPRDVFVLYVSGHGKSIAGRYYYYPQSIDFAAGESVETHGIGQDQWQEWLAKISAQKTLLIFDTCESAAASGLFRGAQSVRQTAMEQLQHATGRNVIAAARQAAYEGYNGHGVLTYTILEAMDPKLDDDPKVMIRAIADYVDARVPELTSAVFGVRQSPVQKLTGNNFPIGLRETLIDDDATIASTPTHVLIAPTLVRQDPDAEAPSNRDLPPGARLAVIEYVGDWALVAREGEPIGYVPVAALARMQ